MAEQPKKMPLLSENGEGSGAPAQPTPLDLECAREKTTVSPVDEKEDGRGEAEDGRPVVEVLVDKKLFHCATCPAPLKPPVFVCESGGHAVCSDCGDGGGSKHCGVCGGVSTYSHHPSVDHFVECSKQRCPNCGISVAYHAMAAHTACCAPAPAAR